MTFLKFLIWKLKNTSSNYWMLLGLRIFVRLMGITTVFYLLKLFDLEVKNTIRYLYDIISTIFYISFFIFLDGYLQVSVKNRKSQKALKQFNLFKWVPLAFCFILIFLNLKLDSFYWPGSLDNRVLYLFTQVWPLVFIPNLSFIINTILIFYASAILNQNKLLKEENDLTI